MNTQLRWTAADVYEKKPLRFHPSFFVVIGAAFILAACSQLGSIQDKERDVSTAQTKYFNVRNHVDAKASDYAQELKYDVSLMPASPNAKVADELSEFLIDLLGPGELTQSKRQAFVMKLLKDDAAAHKAIANEEKSIAADHANMAEKDKQLEIKQAQLKTMAEANATMADQLLSLKHEAIAGFVALLVIFGLFIFLKFTEAGAAIAAKFP